MHGVRLSQSSVDTAEAKVIKSPTKFEEDDLECKENIDTQIPSTSQSPSKPVPEPVKVSSRYARQEDVLAEDAESAKLELKLLELKLANRDLELRSKERALAEEEDKVKRELAQAVPELKSVVFSSPPKRHVALDAFPRCRKPNSLSPSKMNIGGNIGTGSFASVNQGGFKVKCVVRKVNTTKDRSELGAAVAGSVVHPYFVKHLGIMEPEGKGTFYVEEHVNGYSVHDKLSRRETFTYQQVVRFCLQLCLALEKLETSGIVHGAVHPRHLFISTEHNLLKLGGFEYASLREGKESKEVPPLVNEGATFASPNRLAGSPSASSDQYSFGLVMLAMMLGKTVGVDGAKSVPSPPADCPSVVAAVVAKATHDDPAKRPTFAAMAQQLRDFWGKIEKGPELIPGGHNTRSLMASLGVSTVSPSGPLSVPAPTPAPAASTTSERLRTLMGGAPRSEVQVEDGVRPSKVVHNSTSHIISSRSSQRGTVSAVHRQTAPMPNAMPATVIGRTSSAPAPAPTPAPATYVAVEASGMLSTQPATAIATSTPTASYGNSTPTISYGNSTPTISYGNSTPTVGYGNSTPTISYGNRTPTVGYGSSTPTITYGGSTPTISYGAGTPLSGGSTPSLNSINFGNATPTMYGTSTPTFFGGSTPTRGYGGGGRVRSNTLGFAGSNNMPSTVIGNMPSTVIGSMPW